MPDDTTSALSLFVDKFRHNEMRCGLYLMYTIFIEIL